MQTIKHLFEKPSFIWILISVAYISVFFTQFQQRPYSGREETIHEVVTAFAESSFPPRIELVRNLADWGHLGYYSIMGRAFEVLGGDQTSLRVMGMIMMLLVFYLFVRLGFYFTYVNRLNPIWISLGLILLAANPYSWMSAFELSFLPMLLLFMFLGLFAFEKKYWATCSFFTSLAVLVDWRAVLLAVAFMITRVTQDRGKVLRLSREFSLLLPFIVASLPLFAWDGVVPYGEAREWWHLMKDTVGLFHLHGLFYALGLLPIYGFYYVWMWGFKSRMRATTIGLVVTGVLIPFYFLFPIHFDSWYFAKYGMEVPLGAIDKGAVMLVGEYKNLLLFIPWLAGTFLFVQLFCLEVLDISKVLRNFIIMFFLIQPFVIGFGDEQFLIVVPFLYLFSLSEALVGEQGKLV